MKKLSSVLLLLLLTGCATTEYTVNGVPPGDNQTVRIVGSVIAAGLLAKAVAKPGQNYCSSTVKNTMGQTVGTISTTKSTPC
jgi:uncharacterized protein YcfL